MYTFSMANLAGCSLPFPPSQAIQHVGQPFLPPQVARSDQIHPATSQAIQHVGQPFLPPQVARCDQIFLQLTGKTF
jgi:hypothetical protein